MTIVSCGHEQINVRYWISRDAWLCWACYRHTRPWYKRLQWWFLDLFNDFP